MFGLQAVSFCFYEDPGISCQLAVIPGIFQKPPGAPDKKITACAVIFGFSLFSLIYYREGDIDRGLTFGKMTLHSQVKFLITVKVACQGTALGVLAIGHKPVFKQKLFAR